MTCMTHGISYGYLSQTGCTLFDLLFTFGHHLVTFLETFLQINCIGHCSLQICPPFVFIITMYHVKHQKGARIGTSLCVSARNRECVSGDLTVCFHCSEFRFTVCMRRNSSHQWITRSDFMQWRCKATQDSCQKQKLPEKKSHFLYIYVGAIRERQAGRKRPDPVHCPRL